MTSNAYRCDGCHDYFDLVDREFDGPPFVIHNNGPIEFGSTPVLFAHSWDCVARIAERNKEQRA